MEIEVSKRYRINVSQTSTGKKSFDCTVELIDAPMEQILIESDKLVAELSKRYPAEAQAK